MPEPEPVGLYVNVMPVSCRKASPKAPITFCIDVEPSVATEPVTVSLCPSVLCGCELSLDEQAVNAITATKAVIITAIIFFILFSPSEIAPTLGFVCICFSLYG